MRSLVATALVGAALALPVPAAASLPAAPEQGEAPMETPVEAHHARQGRAAAFPPLVARATEQAAEREQALLALFDQAERYQDEQVERAAALAAVGWTGEADEAVVVRPVASYRVSAGFGQHGANWASTHGGLDLAAPTGTTLVAAADATVTEVGLAGPYGLRTILTLEDGTQLWYCHQSATLVSPGEGVTIAEPVGLVGSTGNSTGPHLHLEVRPGAGAPVDPVPWFAALGIAF